MLVRDRRDAAGGSACAAGRAHRQVLYGTLGLGGGGIHTMTLIALGGGPVEIDAVAALP